MATNLLPIHSLGLTASSAPTRRTCAVNRHRSISTSAGAGGNNWWSPIFGWSSEADYIDSKEDPAAMTKPAGKYTPGCFTEEKAKQLRIMTMETESFNEVMYHSAVASRLATHFPRR